MKIDRKRKFSEIQLRVEMDFPLSLGQIVHPNFPLSASPQMRVLHTGEISMVMENGVCVDHMAYCHGSTSTKRVRTLYTTGQPPRKINIRDMTEFFEPTSESLVLQEAPACFEAFIESSVSIAPCDGRCKDNRHTHCPRVAKLQLSTKHSKSWLNYCKQHGLPEGKLKPTKFKADFHAKLREAMGDLFQESSRHRGELCYDHIEFKVD